MAVGPNAGVASAASAALAPLPLPAGLRSRRVDGVNGLSMHLLEAGFDNPSRPLLLLLHGFPELAYSWRKVMPALAAAGYHVVAPDQRGYGRTTGWVNGFDADIGPMHLFNLVRDQLALLAALGRPHVEAVIGHDFGSPVAAWCALIRPDVFRAVALMSAPFGGAPAWRGAAAVPAQVLDAQLAALPQPRRHYQHHYATREAEAEMLHPPQGLHDFLRAYYHVKSADWAPNAPHPLPAMTGQGLAPLPRYYVMDRGRGMAETVAPEMPPAEHIAANTWLPDAELAVYAAEFARTGLQGGLQWYRSALDEGHRAQLRLFAGRHIKVPGCFISGAKDWGTFQVPGAFEAMRSGAIADLRGCHLVEGAGHWVQQEQPQAVSRLLLDFLRGLRP
jgi:pimeloyl-ACP methyl ester carboxylesterase